MTAVGQHLKQSAARSFGRVRDDVRRRATDHASERYREQGVIDATVRLPYGTYIEGGTTIGAYTTFSGPPRIRGLGSLRIGRYCAFGDDFRAITSNHDMRFASTHFRPAKLLGIDEPVDARSTTIGNAVWIGDGVTVLPGVTIGDGSVIGAGSVVSKDVAPFAIAAGTPCRTLRPRFSDQMVAALSATAWWTWTDQEILENRRLFELDLTTSTPADLREFDRSARSDGSSPV